MPVSHSTLILGATGTGKSSFIRSALAALGSGAVAMAPGNDEANSYAEFVDRPGFVFKGFDDDEFVPTIGEWKAEGQANLLRWLRGVYKVSSDARNANKPLPYSVLGLDTVTAMSRLGYNSTLAKFKMTEPPAARGGDGSSFYGLLYQKMDEIMRLTRAIRGTGVHLIAVGHTAERENISEAVVAGVAAPKMIVAQMAGGYRDVLPSFFDNVLHTLVVKNREGKDVFTLQSKPSSKRPTKSRWGALQSGDSIPNSWLELVSRIDAAAATRAALLPQTELTNGTTERTTAEAA